MNLSDRAEAEPIFGLNPMEAEYPVRTKQMRFSEALNHLHKGTAFISSSIDGICAVSIRGYLPLVCTALHDGTSFPAKLEDYSLLSRDERRFEEDPHTAHLLDKLPLVLSGLESRYFYDLNRAEKYATANEIFGRRVWRDRQHPAQHWALSRHRRFYRLAGALIGQLINRYGSCLVLDLHSYNASKHTRETPLFNLGTCSVDIGTHRRLLDHFLAGLSRVELPGLSTSIAENDVFAGRGRFVNWVSRTYPQALTLCLEVKKVYCNEHNGELQPEIFTALQTGLTRVINEVFAVYQQEYLQQECLQTARRDSMRT